MNPVHVAAAAVLGPGLPDWPRARAVLAGEAPWQDGPVALPPPTLLPATERRRAGSMVRLALAVAQEAAAASGLAPATLRTVFASGNGDSPTVCAILDALSQPDGYVSPTQFHNSVHNAAAGYWSIATGSHRPATSLGGYDWSFGCGLMTAVAECAAEGEPVLLCVTEVPMPPPLHAKRPVDIAFGVALVLAPAGPGPRLAVRWAAEAASRAAPRNPALRPLAAANPAARSLRLLEAVASGRSETFDVAVLDGSLAVTVTA